MLSSLMPPPAALRKKPQPRSHQWQPSMQHRSNTSVHYCARKQHSISSCSRTRQGNVLYEDTGQTYQSPCFVMDGVQRVIRHPVVQSRRARLLICSVIRHFSSAWGAVPALLAPALVGCQGVEKWRYFRISGLEPLLYHRSRTHPLL